MVAKIIRDPLYNYISIELDRDEWLVRLIDTPEVQRLRRVHQLGVSDFTYPGASHTRLSHTLGVLHLMRRMHEQAERISPDENIKMCRSRLLAAAVLHDVGHGPFSHLFEPCLGIDHEEWSIKIIKNQSGEVNRILKDFDPQLPEAVAGLIEKDNYEFPPWQKFLLSSQLDADRMDYLRRDSLFTGGDYGHFDWYRLINTFEFYEENGHRDIVWPSKSKFAIEEYIFARFYMYQNVYLHKTTRGFEKLLEAMWKRAQAIHANGDDADLVPALSAFWRSEEPSVEDFLAIEEFTVLHQMQIWVDHDDPCLSDLASRFLNRRRLVMIEAPRQHDDISEDEDDFFLALKEVVGKNSSKTPVESYCLKDRLKGKYNQPYFPEKESDEQSAKNAIRIQLEGEQRPVEISSVLDRLGPITREPRDRVRYYVPEEARDAALRLRNEWKSA